MSAGPSLAIPPDAGQGEVAFERVGPRTVVRAALAKSPLKLLTPGNHGHAAWVFVANFGGGLVDGDHLRLVAHVGAGAAALLGTQSSTKVYRSPSGCAQTLEVTVEEGGLLVAVPDPVVCFAGARYRQAIEIHLAGGASLVLVDAFTAGRSGSGERWEFGRYAARTRIFRGGRLVCHDALELDPAHGALGPRLGRFDAVATVIAVGPRAAEIRHALLALAPPLGRRSELIAAPSLLEEDAVLLRLGGTSVERVTGAIRGVLASLPELLGDDPFARKW